MNIVHCFFKDREIRFIDGNPVANDIAAVLGYADPAKTISTKVSKKNKGVAELVTPGGIQSVAVLDLLQKYHPIAHSEAKDSS